MKGLLPFLVSGAWIFASCVPAGSGLGILTEPSTGRLDGRTLIPIDLSTGRPVVEVAINGADSVPMVFDTGGVGLMIDADLAEELGLPIVGTTRMSSPLGDPDGFEVEQARIESLDLGGARLGEVVVDLWDGVRLFGGENPPRGVLGITLLRDSLVTLDFKKERLTVARGSLPETGPGIVNLGNDQGLPLLPIKVAGNEVLAHLDSGNPGGLHLPFDLKNELPLKEPAVLAGRARTVDASVAIYAGTVAGPVTIAGQQFDDLEVHFLEGSSWANVGLDLMRRFTVTLDQHHQRARLQPLPLSESVQDPAKPTPPCR